MPPKSTATKRKTSSQKKGTKSKATRRKKGTSPILITFAIVGVLLVGAAVFIGLDQNRCNTVLSWLGLNKEAEKDNHVYGIDISRYQENIDWSQLRFYYNSERDTVVYEENDDELPVSFVFIKATQGRASDNTYEEKREQARAHGFKTGAYHVFVNDDRIETQAENFINKAQLDTLDFPPVLDVETKMVSRPYPKVRARVMKWLKLVEDKTGGKPLIYCSDKLREDLFNTPEFEDYHFWIARYDSTPPKSKDDWLFWQFTETGKVKGFKGKVDISRWKGNKAELEQWRKSCWHNPKEREEIEEQIDAAATPSDTTATDSTNTPKTTSL